MGAVAVFTERTDGMRICLTLALVASTIWGTGCASCCSGKCPFSCLKCCKKPDEGAGAVAKSTTSAKPDTVQWEKAKSAAEQVAQEIASSPEPESVAANESTPATASADAPANSTEPGAETGTALSPDAPEPGPSSTDSAPPPPPKVGAAVIEGPAPSAAAIAGGVRLHHDDPRLALEREAKAALEAVNDIQDQAEATVAATRAAADRVGSAGKVAASVVAGAALDRANQEIQTAKRQVSGAARSLEEKADGAIQQAQAVARQKIAEVGAAAEAAVDEAAGLVPVGAVVTPSPPAESEKEDPALYANQKDYMWVQGKLIRIYSRGGYWQIRYAAYDASDSYGGKFVLVGTVPEDVREGDYIRVRGKVLGENKWLTGTEYRIDSVQLVARGQGPFSK